MELDCDSGRTSHFETSLFAFLADEEKELLDAEEEVIGHWRNALQRLECLTPQVLESALGVPCLCARVNSRAETGQGNARPRGLKFTGNERCAPTDWPVPVSYQPGEVPSHGEAGGVITGIHMGVWDAPPRPLQRRDGRTLFFKEEKGLRIIFRNKLIIA